MKRNNDVDYGVPSDFGGLGIIRCLVCDRPYREHDITERCRELHGAFSSQTIGLRHAQRQGVEYQKRDTGIRQVHLRLVEQ